MLGGSVVGGESRLQARTLTYSKAVDRARHVAGVAGFHALDSERLNQLHPEVGQAILESELALLLVPARWGGFGLDWATAFDCVQQVGKACASAAWVMSFLIDHNWVLGLFPEAAQRHVFEQDSRPAIFTASAPEGLVVKAPGGYRLNGEWSFASGVDICRWGLIGGLVAQEVGPPVFLNLLIGPDDYEVHRVWDHFGLKGTGSHNVVLRDVFVPQDHAVSWMDMGAGTAPGRKVNPEPLFRLPLGTAYPLGIMGPAVSVARGALAAFSAWITTKTPMMTPGKIAETLPLQVRLGEASAQIDAGELIVRNNIAKLALADDIPTQERLAITRDYLFAMQLLIAGVDALMNAAGARGGRRENATQRAFRDLHAMRQHALFNFDLHYGAAGRALMGLEAAPGGHALVAPAS